MVPLITMSELTFYKIMFLLFFALFFHNLTNPLFDKTDWWNDLYVHQKKAIVIQMLRAKGLGSNWDDMVKNDKDYATEVLSNTVKCIDESNGIEFCVNRFMTGE